MILLIVIFAYIVRERHALRHHDSSLGRALARNRFHSFTFGSGNSRRQSATWDPTDLGLSYLGSSIGGTASGAEVPSSSSTSRGARRDRAETSFTLLSASSDDVDVPAMATSSREAEEEAKEKEGGSGEVTREEEEDPDAERGAVGPLVTHLESGMFTFHAARDDEVFAVAPVEESSL